MTNWYCLNLGDAMLAGEAIERVCERFMQDADRFGASAVLMRHETAGGLHCELRLFFPPELTQLATALGAQPCGAPAAHGLGVLVGSAARLERLTGDEVCMQCGAGLSPPAG